MSNPYQRTESFSSLKMFAECPQQYKFKYIDKIPANPPPDTNPMAHERGTKIHEELEELINSVTDKYEDVTEQDHPSLKKVLNLINPLIQDKCANYNNKNHKVICEEHITNKHLDIHGFVDCLVIDNTHARVIDFKTGKSWNKIQKYQLQTSLYALLVFEKYPQINTITTELWFIDEGKRTLRNLTKEDAQYLYNQWEHERNKILKGDFLPMPNKSTCRFCDYGIHNNKYVTKTKHCNLDKSEA